MWSWTGREWNYSRQFLLQREGGKARWQFGVGALWNLDTIGRLAGTQEGFDEFAFATNDEAGESPGLFAIGHSAHEHQPSSLLRLVHRITTAKYAKYAKEFLLSVFAYSAYFAVQNQ